MVPWLLIRLTNNSGITPPPPPPPPAPTPIIQQGAGDIVRKPGHSGPYGPAFPSKPRAVRDLYRPIALEPERQATVTETPPKATLSTQSPLPFVMDFGNGPVAIGIKAPSLNETLHNAILADDEDAIVAILLALT